MEQAELDKRFATYPTDPTRQQMHDAVRTHCKAVADALNSILPETREKILSIAKLEEVMYWADACIARHIPTPPEGA